MREEEIAQLVEIILQEIKKANNQEKDCLQDLTQKEEKDEILVNEPYDLESLVRMKKKTAARIGIGKCGARLKTKPFLTLRADHAIARDSVFADVSDELIKRMDMEVFVTKVGDKNQFLTRPDLGREFETEMQASIVEKCEKDCTVVVYASDGLSSKAIEANIENIIPAIADGLRAKGIRMAKPFFVKYGRVGAMDYISQLLNCKVTCVLIGERPGLATAESMSCYMAYEATVGMPESRRTVISNIHSGGISAVEAGAYITEVIEQMLMAKVSGVEFKK